MPILDKAMRDGDWEVRQAAAIALGQVGGEKAIDLLADGLYDWSLNVASLAARSLADMDDPLVVEKMSQLLAKGNHIKRANAIAVLAMRKQPGAADLLLSLLQDSNSDVRANAAKAFYLVKDIRALAPLTAALSDRDKGVRAGAALALGALAAREAVEPLIKSLADRNEVVRANAAISLGSLGDPRAVDSLIATLRDRYAQIRTNAAEALGAIGDARSATALGEMIRDENPRVRIQVAKALGKIGTSLAWIPLCDMVLDPDMLVQLEAVLALDHVADVDWRVIEPLLQAMKSGWYSLRYGASLVLKKVTGQDFGADYEPWSRWWFSNKDKYRFYSRGFAAGRRGMSKNDFLMMGRRVISMLVGLITAAVGLAAMIEQRQDPRPIVVRMFLFQGVPAEGQTGLNEPFSFPVASRPETTGIKTQIKGPENAVAAAVIETLFDAYKLQAVDQLFFHEALWKLKEPTDDWVIGKQTSYAIRLTPTASAAGGAGVHAVISKGKTNSETMLAAATGTLINSDFDLTLDEPILAAWPNPEGDYFLLIWVAEGIPGSQKLGPAPEPIYFVTPPKARDQVRPAFPEELRRRNWSGRIGLKLTINPKGAVTRVDIEKPLYAYLNYSAMLAFRQWTFEPVLIKGKPVTAAFRMEYEFNPRLYTDDQAWAVAPPAGAAAAPQGELATVLDQAAAYCEKLAGIISGYVCEETIQETHYDLMNSRRWTVLAVGPASNIPQAEAEEAARLSTKDSINQGIISDGRIGDGREGRITFKSVFQTFDPQRDKRLKYLCDYQIFKKSGVVEEHRTILKENGRKPDDPKKVMQDRRYSALGSLFAPLRVLSKDRQPKFLYFLAGEEKIAGRKALIMMITPRSGDQDGILSAQVWLDKATRQVLKCEIEGIPLDGQEDILNECASLNVRPQFLTVHEYKSEKDGVLFPWRSDVEAAYPGIDPRGPSPRLKIAMAYDKYKFFSVATEHEVIR